MGGRKFEAELRHPFIREESRRKKGEKGEERGKDIREYRRNRE